MAAAIEEGCKGPHRFDGAKFHYLAASTFLRGSGKTLFPPYEIRSFDGIPVAFIGLTLKGTPDIISPAAAAGLEFRDEAETVNALVPELRAKGVEAIVVLIHEGGYPTGDYNECPAISGAIVDIVKKFDKAVDVVISGHTHQAYICEIDGRLVTSADKFGTLVTAIDLKLDPATRDVISAKAGNTIVRTSSRKGSRADRADRVRMRRSRRPSPTAAPAPSPRRLSRVPNLTGESVLGDVVADAQLAATRSEDQWRRRDGLHQSRRHPHRHRDEGRRRGELCGCVRRAAVPQPPGHADADRRADQGDAGAAMARSGAAAHPAGLRRAFPTHGMRQSHSANMSTPPR